MEKQPPFRGNLENSNFPGDYYKALYQLQQDPEKIVRLIELQRLGAMQVLGPEPTKLAAPEKYLALAKAHFSELNEKYGVANSGFWPVIGHDKRGEPAAYIVTEKVHGLNLHDALINPNSTLINKADDMLAGLGRYYHDVLTNGGMFIYDLRIEQFIYGHKAGETEDKLYLVDLDPHLMEYPPADNLSGARTDLVRRAANLRQGGLYYRRMKEERAQEWMVIARPWLDDLL